MVPVAAVGTVAIIAGGLAAAVTRPAGWSDGSWVAAYLVLVTGVGQIGLGVGQSLLAQRPSRARLAAQLVLLNAGSALVVLGTLVDQPPVVTAGGVVLVAGLVLFATAPRRDGRLDRVRGVLGLYLGLLAVLIVSIPIGLALSWIRA